jgi:lysylphosphatidylglycerol synthetase-like protein (DUF2156 family)
MVFNATFNNTLYFSYIMVVFYLWRKTEYPEKTTVLLQVTLSHNVVPSYPRRSVPKKGISTVTGVFHLELK